MKNTELKGEGMGWEEGRIICIMHSTFISDPIDCVDYGREGGGRQLLMIVPLVPLTPL